MFILLLLSTSLTLRCSSSLHLLYSFRIGRMILVAHVILWTSGFASDPGSSQPRWSPKAKTAVWPVMRVIRKWWPSRLRMTIGHYRGGEARRGRCLAMERCVIFDLWCMPDQDDVVRIAEERNSAYWNGVHVPPLRTGGRPPIKPRNSQPSSFIYRSLAGRLGRQCMILSQISKETCLINRRISWDGQVFFSRCRSCESLISLDLTYFCSLYFFPRFHRIKSIQSTDAGEKVSTSKCFFNRSKPFPVIV